jgi:Winged helix DNA-binding domain
VAGVQRLHDRGGPVPTWTVRGAPHAYRRADLPDVATAVQPWSEADAARRIYDASKPLAAAGIPVLTALDRLAGSLRDIVRTPMVKGDVSGALSSAVDPPYVRECVPCGATHVWEMPFRLAATRAGLELEAGTSPPVLHPVPGLVPASDPDDRVDLVRACVRLLGPTTPRLVAGYLEAPVEEVERRWPQDVVDVRVEGQGRQVLAQDADLLDGGPVLGTRLLGPYDLLLQARDRALLVDDAARAKRVWPALGRPGVVLADGAAVGTWRPRASGTRLRVAVELWEPVSGVEEQAERLAEVRGVRLTGVDVSGR